LPLISTTLFKIMVTIQFVIVIFPGAGQQGMGAAIAGNSLFSLAAWRHILDLSYRIEVSTRTFMLYKRNQVEDAIYRIFRASDERARELKLRMKRLLVTDRRLILKKGSEKRFAFFSQEPPGSGTEVMFSDYEAFALIAGLRLLEHGIPQATVVSVLRQLRPDLENANRETLKKDPKRLFDPAAVKALAKPGMIATDNIAPIFLVVLKLPDSTADQVHAVMTVCRGHDEVTTFIRKHAATGLGATMFEFAGLMHRLSKALSETRPVKRGRSSI
jgi:hypothetical protein